VKSKLFQFVAASAACTAITGGLPRDPASDVQLRTTGSLPIFPPQLFCNGGVSKDTDCPGFAGPEFCGQYVSGYETKGLRGLRYDLKGKGCQLDGIPPEACTPKDQYESSKACIPTNGGSEE
jgi:hypothetical protein